MRMTVEYAPTARPNCSRMSAPASVPASLWKSVRVLGTEAVRGGSKDLRGNAGIPAPRRPASCGAGPPGTERTGMRTPYASVTIAA